MGLRLTIDDWEDCENFVGDRMCKGDSMILYYVLKIFSVQDYVRRELKNEFFVEASGVLI